MRSEYPAVQNLLTAILSTVTAEQKGEVKAEDLRDAFSGLQGMDSDCANVQRILQFLLSVMRSTVLSPEETEVALLGLRMMREDCPEVIAVVEAFNRPKS